MRYVLAIGIETEIFKKPVLEVFLNDRFLGMSDLEESIPAQLQKHKKGNLLDAWDRGNSTKHPERIYDIMVPKKHWGHRIIILLKIHYQKIGVVILLY